MSVICPICAAVNRAGALHCKSCGSTLATAPLPSSAVAPAAASLAVPAALCPECQAPVRVGARFCGHCGCALAAAAPAATPTSLSPAPVLESTPAPATVDTTPSPAAAANAEPSLAVEVPAEPLNPPLAPTQPWVIDIDLPAPTAVAASPLVDVVKTAAVTTEATYPMPATDAVFATPTALPAAVVDAPAAASPRAEPAASHITSLDSPKPPARPLAPLFDDAALTAEGLEETTPARSPMGLYAGVALAGVAVVGALAWWLLRDAPAVASAPAASPAVVATTAITTAAAPARTPDEEIITEPAEPAATAAPESPVAVAPAVAPPLETPAVVASAAPARPAPPRPRPAPGASNDPPWQHPGSRAPAPASLSAPGAAPVAAPPMPPPDPLAPLRADLRQCDGESNILGKGVCVVRARHRHCGNHWGKVPECPLSQRSRDPYDN